MIKFSFRNLLILLIFLIFFSPYTFNLHEQLKELFLKKIRALTTSVVPLPSNVSLGTNVSALVKLATLVPLLTVDQNVWLALNAPRTKLVSTRDVKILALVDVV